MKWNLNTRDIGFNSSSEQLEAFRRAVEIRDLVRSRDGFKPGKVDGLESYVWETKLGNGRLELEHVTIDSGSESLTYARSEFGQAC